MRWTPFRADWRYLDPYREGEDNARRRPNPGFVLNRPEYAEATILLARENFGCGSSREHAPRALKDFGIRALIAPSFADIFFSNCFKNGLLPVRLTAAQVDTLFAQLAANFLFFLDDHQEQPVGRLGQCLTSGFECPERSRSRGRGLPAQRR